MKHTSFAQADTVYRCSAHHGTKLHIVWHPLFRHFCLALSRFERNLGELATDDYWAPWLRSLRRYRFDVSAAPLPFDHPAVAGVEQLTLLQAHVRHCASVYPIHATTAHTLLDSLNSLVTSKDNPMLGVLERMRMVTGNMARNTALLIREPRLLPAVESVLALVSELKALNAVSPSDLRDSLCYRDLIVVGPARWFPDHVFTAARAAEVDLIQYSWIRDEHVPTPAFAGSREVGTSHHLYPARVVQHGREAEDDIDGDGSGLDAGEILPRTDWASISTPSATAGDDQTVDRVEARLFLLSTHRAVYLDDDDQSSALVIDLYEEGDARLQKRRVGTIEPGMFVLLRTESGGDYIVPVADRIMGATSLPAREAQKHWKVLLRHRVRGKGLATVVNELRQSGAAHASELNVRNWMSPRTIRPADDGDFAGILRTIGLQGHVSEYGELMQAIRHAHIQAGQRIRQLLLAQVAEADLRDLERQGTMTFTLDEAGGGSLTAFRVEDVSPERFMVASSQPGHPFTVRGGLWRA